MPSLGFGSKTTQLGPRGKLTAIDMRRCIYHFLFYFYYSLLKHQTIDKAQEANNLKRLNKYLQFRQTQPRSLLRNNYLIRSKKTVIRPPLETLRNKE